MRRYSFQQQTLAPLLVVSAILICFYIYWPGLYGPLLLDDISNLGRILDPKFSSDDILLNLFNDNGLFKRPVAMVTFILNGLTTNDLFYWKLTNLVIHICCSILIYFFSIRLLRCIDSENQLLAAIVAIAWLLHPLQVSTVLYTVQRMTELSALFIFAAMTTYIIARERQLKKLTSWPLQVITWGIFFPAGLFSKENALLLPAFIMLIEAFSFNKQWINNQNLPKLIALVSFCSISILTIMWEWIQRGYTFRNFSLLERLYSEGNVLTAYLGMLIFPAQRRMGFVHDDFPISSNLLQPWTTLPSISLILFLLIIAIYYRKKFAPFSFGIIFYFLGHTMESSVIGLELMYEHRNYLPSFGIFLAATFGINEVIKNRKILTFFSTAIFSLLIFTTFLRTDTWSSTERLYFYMEITHPHSERLATIKSTQYANAGDYTQARKRLEGFTSLGAKFQRLNIDCIENKFLSDDQLSIPFKQTEKIDNYATLQLTNLANRGLDSECTFSSEAFVKLINRIITPTKTSRANRSIISMYKAHFLWKEKRSNEALRTLDDIFQSHKDNPTPLFLKCEWLLDAKRMSEAENACGKALTIADKAPFKKYKKLADNARDRIKLFPDNR